MKMLMIFLKYFFMDIQRFYQLDKLTAAAVFYNFSVSFLSLALVVYLDKLFVGHELNKLLGFFSGKNAPHLLRKRAV